MLCTTQNISALSLDYTLVAVIDLVLVLHTWLYLTGCAEHHKYLYMDMETSLKCWFELALHEVIVIFLYYIFIGFFSCLFKFQFFMNNLILNFPLSWILLDMFLCSFNQESDTDIEPNKSFFNNNRLELVWGSNGQLRWSV